MDAIARSAAILDRRDPDTHLPEALRRRRRLRGTWRSTGTACKARCAAEGKPCGSSWSLQAGRHGRRTLSTVTGEGMAKVPTIVRTKRRPRRRSTPSAR
jgi:hypothetical protein